MLPSRLILTTWSSSLMSCILLFFCMPSESLLDIRYRFTFMKTVYTSMVKTYSWAMFLDIGELLRDVYVFDACYK